MPEITQPPFPQVTTASAAAVLEGVFRCQPVRCGGLTAEGQRELVKQPDCFIHTHPASIAPAQWSMLQALHELDAMRRVASVL
jgi:hypothetical protein